MKRIGYISLLIVCLTVLASSSSFARQQLRAVSIESEGRAIFKFADFPINFKSTLSDDKRRVVLDIKDCSVIDSARNKAGSGDINEIYVQTTGKDLSIFVSLSEQFGYTAVPLQYSRAILVDVFKWDKLSPAEDHFRTALLALEDNIITSAKTDLLSAAMDKHPEAALFNGIILLSEGKVNSAIKNLEFAEKAGASLPDMYAALSQAYSIKQDNSKSKLYADKFKQATGMSFVPAIPIAALVETDTMLIEPTAHLVYNEEPVLTDTSEIDSATNKRFETLFADSATAESNDLIPGVYNEIVTIVAGIALAALLLVLLLYLRWRNKQMLMKAAVQDTPKSKQAKKTVAEKKAETEQKNVVAQKLFAAKAYSKQNESQNANIATSKPVQMPEKKDAEKPNTIDKAEQKDIEKLLETIRDAAGASNDAAPQIKTEIETKKKNIPAKLEMALNLAEEQRRIKQKNINELGKSIEIDHTKLTETAKKLGIEKGSLETKKAIESIEQDDEAIRKLKEKFLKRQ